MRVAIVTGASSGIGEATARALAAAGWRCVLVARRQDRLEPLAAEIGGEFELCDVGEREAVERVAASVLERHPRIDLLVNNAGIPGRGDFLTLAPDRIEAVLRTNYLGSVWCARAFLPGLVAGSRIVNVVSVAGTVAFAPAGPYAASKHAQLAFSRSLASLLGERGIRVLTVNPGFVETEGFPQRAVLANAFFRRAVIGPDDVARHILRVLEQNRRESFVPGWYRIFAVAQVLAPGLVGRIMGRSGYRRA